MTLSEQIIEYLKTYRKSKELKSNSSRYRKFSSVDPNIFYWVGKNGAIRKGPTIKDSYSITDFIKRVIQLKKGKNNVSTN